MKVKITVWVTLKLKLSDFALHSIQYKHTHICVCVFWFSSHMGLNDTYQGQN